MNDTANTAPALQAVKQPLWMAFATLDELNAYLKRQKTSTAKADEVRAKWLAQEVKPASSSSVPTEGAVEYSPVQGPGSTGSAENNREGDAAANFVAKGQDAQAAVDDVIAKAKGTKRVKATIPAPTGLVTRYIDPTLIDVREGWNARVDFGDLEELANQIKTQKAFDGHGLLNDIRVQDKGDDSGHFWLVDGERRYQAVMGLIDRGEFFEFGIPAKVEAADANLDDLVIKMFLANEGKRLLPYEEGMYFKRLQDSGMTIKEMEAKTGRSDSSIWYGLALVVADDDLVQAVIKGTIGTTLAKTIAVNARGDKPLQKALVAEAKQVKKSGDKKALATIKKKIDDARRAKAAKERPALKIKARKADEATIAELGTNVGMRLKECMEKFGLDHDTNMEEWIGNDRELQIAANFGALQALKAIMGVKVKVQF